MTDNLLFFVIMGGSQMYSAHVEETLGFLAPIF
jgi:hypothetical protein